MGHGQGPVRDPVRRSLPARLNLMINPWPAHGIPDSLALNGGSPLPCGTTTQFAALNVPDWTVLGRCMARHRPQEFIRFLSTVEAAVPAGKLVHCILDNYATHKHPRVRAWLDGHERWTFHYTPTSGS